MKRRTKLRVFEGLCLLIQIGVLAFVLIDFWLKTGINVFAENVFRAFFAETMQVELAICIPIEIVATIAGFYFDIEAGFEEN